METGQTSKRKILLSYGIPEISIVSLHLTTDGRNTSDDGDDKSTINTIGFRQHKSTTVFIRHKTTMMVTKISFIPIVGFCIAVVPIAVVTAVSSSGPSFGLGGLYSDAAKRAADVIAEEERLMQRQREQASSSSSSSSRRRFPTADKDDVVTKKKTIEEGIQNAKKMRRDPDSDLEDEDASEHGLPAFTFWDGSNDSDDEASSFVLPSSGLDFTDDNIDNEDEDSVEESLEQFEEEPRKRRTTKKVKRRRHRQRTLREDDECKD